MNQDLYLSNTSNKFRQIIDFVIGIIMVGAQQFSLPLIPYLIIIFLGNKKLSNFLNNKISSFILILISLSIFSLFLREYPLLESIKVSRFFFGLPFIFLFLSPKLTSRLKYPIIIAFIAWNLIEIIITYVTGEPPFYIKNFFLEDGMNVALKKTVTGENTFRLLGPVINSSINGTIAACILVASIFNKEIVFPNTKTLRLQQIIIPILTLIIFFFSASGTGYAVIGFLLINKLFWPTIYAFFKNFRIKLVSLIVLAFGLIASFQILVLIPNVYRKIEWEYISFVFKVKISEISEFLNIGDVGGLLFGIDYDPQFPIVNGDFIILSLVSTFGIGFLFFLVFILLKIFPSNRIYFFALLLSSIHYGTLFTVTGQVICSIVFSSNKKFISSSKFDYLE